MRWIVLLAVGGMLACVSGSGELRTGALQSDTGATADVATDLGGRPTADGGALPSSDEGGAGDVQPSTDRGVGADSAGPVDASPADPGEAPDRDTSQPADTKDTGPDLPTAPAGCCVTDSDCDEQSASTGLDLVCRINGIGRYPSHGLCMERPPLGRCWTGADCGAEEVCVGGEFCACDAPCENISWGVCAPEGGGCAVFDGACDDAIPDTPWWYFDGNACEEEDSCVCGGCPGTFMSKEQCEAACGIGTPRDCERFVAAPMDCPYTRPRPGGGHGAGRAATARPAPSKPAADCSSSDPTAAAGAHCVLGSCVDCWNDAGCEGDLVCRAGRCVERIIGCPRVDCTEPGCKLVSSSELPCPICVCASMYTPSCEKDEDCMIFSSHRYLRCVYGRCTDCMNDADCCEDVESCGELPLTCMAPGLCHNTIAQHWRIVGTWLVGWSGAMNHFSYFRFEADGTLRRGRYSLVGVNEPWSDDMPHMPCYPAGVVPSPLLGTWEPLLTDSGSLAVKVSLNISCDPGEGWSETWRAEIGLEGQAAFHSDEQNRAWEAWRVSPEACTPDFSSCEVPSLP